MVIGRRSLLLAGAALPVAARAQCVTDTPAVDACRGGVRITQPPGATLDLSFMTPGSLDPRITFTRAAGPATYFDSSGVMRTAAVNLWLQSADASNAAWSSSGSAGAPVVSGNQAIAPDGTTTAARVAYPAVSAGAYSNLAQQPALALNPYSLSVWLRGSVGGERLYLMTTTDAVTYYRQQATLTTAWQRFTVTTPSISGGYYWQIGTDLRDGGQTGTPAQTIYVWGGQLEAGSSASPYIHTTTAPNGAPRWDYDPVTHALRGLLIEEARTNISPTVSSYTFSNATITPNSGTGPDGANSLCRVTPSSTSAAHYILINTYTFVAAASYTLSVYAAAQQYQYLQLFIDDGTNGGFATFDLLGGVVSGPLTARGAGVIGTASITPAGNGLYRCSIVAAGTGTTACRAGYVLSNVPNPVFAPVFSGTTANGLLVWGAQLEQGAFPTSYIPTTAAAVTRAADACSMPIAAWYDQTKGSLQFEWMLEGYPVNFGAPIQFVGANQNTDYIDCDEMAIAEGAPTLASLVGAGVSVGGTSVASIGYSTTGANFPKIPAGTVQKGATSWAPGLAMGGAHAGVLAPLIAGTVTATPVVTALTVAGVMHYQAGPSIWARRARYWPRALTAAELQSVTT